MDNNPLAKNRKKWETEDSWSASKTLVQKLDISIAKGEAHWIKYKSYKKKKKKKKKVLLELETIANHLRTNKNGQRADRATNVGRTILPLAG